MTRFARFIILVGILLFAVSIIFLPYLDRNSAEYVVSSINIIVGGAMSFAAGLYLKRQKETKKKPEK